MKVQMNDNHIPIGVFILDSFLDDIDVSDSEIIKENSPRLPDDKTSEEETGSKSKQGEQSEGTVDVSQVRRKGKIAAEA